MAEHQRNVIAWRALERVQEGAIAPLPPLTAPELPAAKNPFPPNAVATADGFR